MSDLRSLAPEIKFRRGISYAGGLVAIGVIYFVLAKGGLTLASINPSATPIWPPTGVALAAVLLRGYWTWPAIFIAAMIANATTAGSVATAIAIATGNTLEAIVGAYLVNRWSSGCNTFSRPDSVAKFALICIVIATPISASIGLTSLAAAGYIDRTDFVNAWVTWWLGDVTGALVIAPALVLWTSSRYRAFSRNELLETVGVLATAAVVGLIAYSPLIAQTPSRDPLGFLAILPMLWAALRRGPRDTATVALVLAGITIWGTLTGGGPFTTADLNASFLLVLMFLISITVPSLLLSADVEVRKKGEERLRRAQIELERKVAERTQELELANAAKSRFLAMASHDLRQPLHALGLFVAQLRTGSGERIRTIELVDATRKEMDEMLNSLLDMSRLDAGILIPTITEFPIARLLQKIETTFDQATRETGLRLRVRRSDAWVRSDAMLLERILLNLVSNAVRYTLRGGIIVGCRRRGQMLRIEVWDSGSGIPEDQKQNIFGEFFQLAARDRNRYGSMGLGLAIVDRLRLLLNHPIDVASTVGRGSRFAILVPMAEERDSSTEPVDSPHPAAFAVEGKVVLVIIDAPIVQEGTVGLLGRWGYTVLTTGSDEVALIRLAERRQRPDLIISDYHLASGKTGIGAIEQINAAFGSSIPAILISGDTAPEPAREAKDRGYVMLHKPVDPMRLRAVMHELFMDHDDRRDDRSAS
ncbi:MASE1 domain-containing protein [Bradyrhizobium sp. SSUT18]|uniref:MASE1 domain-containing protein n=1 Tax=unclassified Bradyrhizobium TaxID=2631580 RepID=UPI00244A08CC|nr:MULTISPECIES: MASE1 domain-containing protein [unclassified Bradyrhizobium]MDH2354170.1 MASE1 domain-containing protein [Bradyrhizobium sp. SSUT112]MDH2400609.1 MASE1 domain-containing protein [Bradyrhizobium sp. SSUT18]